MSGDGTKRAPRTAHIVSHTHWDREWYHPFHQFRVNLLRIMKRVVDALEADDDFEHFLMDGQCAVLEDYLEIHPEDRDRIARLVSDGKLTIGPWYVLPDEFLVSGEATIRNLIVGHRAGGAFGGVQKVGYMPDSFGHIAQMPQILRQAGIDSFVFTRGLGDEIDDLGHEFFWRAPDGSEVLAINQCEMYCNAGGLGFEEIWHAHTRREVSLERAVEQIGELFGKLSRHSNGDVYLLNNGCDHFPPQREFAKILESLRNAFPATIFVHSSLASYLDAVRTAGFARGPFAGEMIGSRLNQLFPGVWSSRMPLKQQNDLCQRWLSNYLEPVLAYSHFVLGQPYPSGLVEYAWKFLMKNHPHDSICGCSTDEVHREMVPRFEGVAQTAEQEIRRRLESLAPTFARRAEDDRDTVLCVMNPLPVRRTEIVTRMIVLQPAGYDPARMRLLDDSGREVTHDVIDVRYVERFWGIDYRTELFYEQQRDKFQVYVDRFGERILKTEAEKDVRDCYVTIQFAAELPALGHATFYFTDRAASGRAPAGTGDVTVAEGVLENELLRVSVHGDGTLDVEDKRTGERYEGLNRFEDTEDAGDEYDWSPCEESSAVTSAGARGDVRIVEETRFRACLEVEFELDLPASLTPDRDRRSERRVSCRVKSRIRITHDVPVVEVETTVDNRAEDHRLRVAFPTGVTTDTVTSSGHFYLNERPVGRRSPKGWAQPPAATYPQQEYSFVTGGRRSLAVINKGLPEIEARRGHGSIDLLLTLFRSVGWLSRDDFVARNFTNAGPTLYTPDAQCHGELRFEYAVAPVVGEDPFVEIQEISARYRTPPVVIQGVEDLHTPGGTGLFKKSSRYTSVSAIKKCEDRDTLVVRLYNLAGVPVDEMLVFSRALRGAWSVNILEEREEELEPEGARLRVELGPHQIASVEVEFEDDSP